MVATALPAAAQTLPSVDPELGGIQFRGESKAFSEKSLLKPIFTSDLFEMIAVSLGDARLQSGALFYEHAVKGRLKFPQSDSISGLNLAMSQAFVRRVVADVLDTEAKLAGLSQEVPKERIDYAVRFILIEQLQALVYSPWSIQVEIEKVLNQIRRESKSRDEALLRYEVLGVPAIVVEKQMLDPETGEFPASLQAEIEADPSDIDGKMKAFEQRYMVALEEYQPKLIEKLKVFVGSQGKTIITGLPSFEGLDVSVLLLFYQLNAPEGIFAPALPFERNDFREETFEAQTTSLVRRLKNKEAGRKVLALFGADEKVFSAYEGEIQGEERKKVIDDFLVRYRSTMGAYVKSSGASLPQANKVLPADELSPELTKYFLGKLNLDEDELLFRRLRTFVGNSPFDFVVDWLRYLNRDKADHKLAQLSGSFKENWPQTHIIGRSKPNLIKGPFPVTLEGFRSFVRQQLRPIVLKLSRKKIVDTWLATDPRYKSLFNPTPPAKPAFESDRYNALDPMLLSISENDLKAMYEERPDSLARELDENGEPKELKKHVISEIELSGGKSPGSFRRDLKLIPCFKAFSTAVRAEYDASVKRDETDLREQGTSCQLSALEATKEVYRLRTVFSKTLLTKAKQAMDVLKDEQGAPLCSEMKVLLTHHIVDIDEKPSTNERQMGRVSFLSNAYRNPKLKKLIYPISEKVASDSATLIYTYVKPVEDYLPLSNPKVRGAVKDAVLQSRLATAVGDIFKNKLISRYLVKAKTETFDYGDLHGIHLLKQVTKPDVWITELFGPKTKCSVFNRADELFQIYNLR